MMDGFNSSSVNGAIELELMPETGSFNLNLTVSHGASQHQVVVPANSTFGDLKSVISQMIGLEPEAYKLLFRGKEKDDGDHLQAAGVKDGSKVLVMEDTAPVQKVPEKVETPVVVSPEKVEAVVVSRGDEAVAAVREEVDKLADQVLALQAVVEGGTKVDDRDFLYLTEMLMRQLLKLDGIEAEGEGRVKRKMEVRRVQSFVDTVDALKSRNADHDVNDNATTASATTQCETTEPTEPSSIPVFPSPDPAPPSVMMSSTSTPVPVSIPCSTPVPSSPPSNL